MQGSTWRKNAHAQSYTNAANHARAYPYVSICVHERCVYDAWGRPMVHDSILNKRRPRKIELYPPRPNLQAVPRLVDLAAPVGLKRKRANAQTYKHPADCDCAQIYVYICISHETCIELGSTH